MGRKKHLKGFSIVHADMKVHVSMDRINRNLDRAQFWLDNQIMEDMSPLMPMNEGNFINATKAKSRSLAGSGVVVAGIGPMGRYLYEGKVMVDEETGKGPRNIPGVGLRFRKGAKLVETNRPLTYSNPSARPEWFEVAKKKHVKEWVDGVKEKVGGK